MASRSLLALLSISLGLLAARAAAAPQSPPQPPVDLSGTLSGTRQPPGARTETKHLVVTTSHRRIGTAPAGRLTLYANIAPKPRMHVYAPEQKGVISVAIVLTPADGVTAGTVTFPRPERYFFAPLKETQLVYSKPFRVGHEVTLSAPVATIAGTLRYQACDDAICYVPQSVPVVWAVGSR